MNSLFQKIVHKGYALIENIFFKHFSLFTKKNTLLLLRIDSIGDYILFRNFIQELKSSEKYKNYTITLCGNSWWKELAETLDAGVIDRFIWVDYNNMSDNKYRFTVYKKIFFSRFETVIHPTYSRDIHADNIVNHSGAQHKIGYDGDTVNLSREIKEHNNQFYTKLITTTHPYRFEFYRNKDFFESLFKENITLKKPKIEPKQEADNYILFFPGAKDSFRRWNTKHFAELATRLSIIYPSFKIRICGSSGDSTLAAEIISNTTVSIEDLTGKYSLVELLDVICASKLIVANDSGPFHLCVALNRTVVCISNGNNYGRFTPYPEEMKTNSIVLYPSEILSYSEEDRLRKFHKMVKDVDINDITVTEVYNAITNHFKLKEC